MIRIVIILCFLVMTKFVLAQPELEDSVLTLLQKTKGNKNSAKIIKVKIDHKVFPALIQDGDTIIVVNLSNVKISSPKSFDNREDYRKYLKYRRYAAIVYPYAKESIRIFREAEYATLHMKKRKKKKYLRKLSKELESKFETPLKNLTKTQGKIMVKMIERELGRSTFDLVKETSGRWKAAYWNQSSKLYGYRLKEGYTYGQRPILDVVLMDFDISYDLSANN